MTVYRTAATVLAVSAAILLAPSAASASSCLTPRADSASGATFTITSATVPEGGTIRFTGTGFERTDTDGLGQTLAFKLNDQVQWSQTIAADDDGRVSGSLSLGDLPAADVADIVDRACGKTWVRVLVGSSAAGDMAPSRSIAAAFEVSAAATPTPISTAGARTGGELPDTGIEDVPPVAWLVGLAGIAAIALAAERVVRRRTTASS